MYSKSQTFLKYFKSEAKSLSRSSKLNFNIGYDRIFLQFNTLFPTSNLGGKSSRRVLQVVGAY